MVMTIPCGSPAQSKVEEGAFNLSTAFRSRNTVGLANRQGETAPQISHSGCVGDISIAAIPAGDGGLGVDGGSRSGAWLCLVVLVMAAS